MPNVLWNRAGNPSRWVSDRLGIERWQLKEAIHTIKKAGNLAGSERVIIYDNGLVTDDRGSPIGNIYDEI